MTKKIPIESEAPEASVAPSPRVPALRLSIVIVALAALVIANLFFAPQPERKFFTDAEFSLTHQLQTERAQWYIQWGKVWMPDITGAIHYMCVDPDSRHYAFLQWGWNVRGTKVVTDCSPLDFTDRPADRLHPNLITEDFSRTRTFYAYDPSYEPQGDWAILVEAKENTFVMVHVDTLRHLGLADVEIPQ